MSTLLLIEIDSCTFHLDDFVFECLDIFHILVELLLGAIDLLHLAFEVLEEEFLEHTKLESLLVLQNLKDEERWQDVLLPDGLESSHELIIASLFIPEVCEGLDP